MWRALGWAAGVVLGFGCLPPASQAAPPVSSVSRAGPALTVAGSETTRALICPVDLRTAERRPVLLVSGTGISPDRLFGRNWMPALRQRGVPYCSVRLPYDGLGDIQIAGEYVVAAIRAMYAAAQRPISIVGASQGGIVPRWALRFWPDTRRMVDDVIGLAPTNHGVPAGDIVTRCAPAGCPAASMQQAAGSRFLQALNSREETFAGISYTQIRSRADELILGGAVAGSRARESLAGRGRITNVAIQELCPDDQSGHAATGTISNTAWAIAVDALEHDGPANVDRVPAATCLTPLMPGVPPGPLRTEPTAPDPGAPKVLREPAIEAYVFDRRRPGVSVAPRRLRIGRLVRLRVRVTTRGDDPLPGARVTAFGRTVRTDVGGLATVRVRPARRGQQTVRIRYAGLPTATIRVAVR